MRTIRHTSYVQQQKRLSRWVAFFGFALLTGSLWIALNPDLLIPAYIAMFAGFVIFNMGMQRVGKWSRNPRNDQLLDRQLAKLGDRYTLVHYPNIGNHRTEHLLVYPGGILVLTPREIDGTVEYTGGRWRRNGSMIRRLFAFSGPQLGNPNKDTDEAIAQVEGYLGEKQLEIDVNGLVVFVHPMVQLEVEEPEYPVLHGEEVPTFIQQLPADETFTTEERDELLALLGEGGEVEAPQAATTRRRPVKRRAA